ncbi:MAG: hypothetical protein Ta2A_13810 [Treponemataceae bacterium]|nr:MAG: hypothetical protein Ta2A_13810 [Treponemataceae bacterium]
MKIITNELDIPKRPRKELQASLVSLDFAYSDDANEIDNGLHEVMHGLKLSMLAIGIALHRMNENNMFVKLKYKSFSEYVAKLIEDTGMSRAYFYRCMLIGQVYMTYRADLELIGFSETDSASTLPYLPRALKTRSKKDVFKNLKKMGRIEFIEWAKGEQEQKTVDGKPITIKNGGLYIDETPVVSFSPLLAGKDRAYYERLLLTGAEAKEANEVIGAYRFYDERERKIFDKVYERELKIIRAKR